MKIIKQRFKKQGDKRECFKHIATEIAKVTKERDNILGKSGCEFPRINEKHSEYNEN